MTPRDLIQLLRRLVRFPFKPANYGRVSIYSRWHRIAPTIPFPVRLASGHWWLLDSDYIGEIILGGHEYEGVERQFFSSSIRSGMTVLDIGAHRGFHSLLFSKLAGKTGHVFSFEPSPAEAARLRLNLKLNRCRNVKVFEFALGEMDQMAPLYTVPDNGVLNSLRAPDTSLAINATNVRVRILDEVLAEAQRPQVDFIKLDVEGGELGVLLGAKGILSKPPRPVIVCEILEQRTAPWGYAGRQVASYLCSYGFDLFELMEPMRLSRVESSREVFNGNFIAVPVESVSLVAHLIKPEP